MHLPFLHGAWLVSALATFMVLASPPATLAATPDQAKAFSERAAAYIEKVGEEKAFAHFTRRNGGFVEGEFYVFCYDRNGVNKAHGSNPAFVSRNLLHIKDRDGRQPNALIVKMGFEQGRDGWTSNGQSQ